MKYWPITLKNKNLFYISISVLLFILINSVNIYYYLKAPYIPGWDGMGHAAFSYAYQNQIFPHFFGQLSIWFNGVPFPNFYPPLFYIITSFLSLFGDQNSFILIFKIFNILMLIVTVICFFYLSLQLLIDKNKSLFSTFIFIFLISTYDKIGDLGISVESVFNYGFLPQSFSFIFFLLFMIFFNKENTIKNRILSLLTLLCVSLSNIHILFITVFYILTYYAYLLYVKNFKLLKIKIIDCLIAAFLSSFWYLPMLYYYDFSSAKSSNYGGGKFIDTYLIISIILSLITLYFAKKEKKYRFIILSIYVFIVSILNYTPLADEIVELPLHVKRWVIIPIVFSPLLISYLINKNKLIRNLMILILILISIIFLLSIKNQNYKGYLQSKGDIPELISWITKNKNIDKTLINIESEYIDNSAEFWYIHALLGMNDIKTTYAILRESSIISSTFATIRNSFSMNEELVGTKFNLFGQNKIGNDFIDQGIDIGITDFLAKSTFSKKILSKNENVYLEKDFGEWSLFKAKNPVDNISDKNLKAVLTYTDFNLKKNTENIFDLSRINEELIWSNKMDVIFYINDNLDLSEKTNYSAASAIFIPTYKYSDIDKAYKNIVGMSKHRPIFLLKDYDDKLFNKIYKSNKNTQNIYFIDKKYHTINTYRSHRYYRDIFEYIDNRITYKTDKFIYIRQSYFPNHKNLYKQYIASPFYILESKTELNNNKLNIYLISGFISLIAFIISTIYFIYIYRRDY